MSVLFSVLPNVNDLIYECAEARNKGDTSRVDAINNKIRQLNDAQGKKKEDKQETFTLKAWIRCVLGADL